MRVLHVVKSLDRGGAEVLLIETGRASRPEVVPSYAYFLRRSSAVVSELASIGGVTCLGATNNADLFSRVPDLSRLLRRERPDIVHAHLPLAGVAARWAGAETGIPVVYTEHNSFHGYHPATQVLARATWRLQRAVIAVSDDVRQSLPESVNDPPVFLVPNGVPVQVPKI